jgi:crotonobetainyl-CoA:carnitine CoA-transferase CaiB-like acyl-CoA transferase
MLPRLGEHTVAVLADLGFAGEEIDALVGAKIARQLRG